MKVAHLFLFPAAWKVWAGRDLTALPLPAGLAIGAPPQAGARPPTHPGPGRVGAPPAVGVPDACLVGTLLSGKSHLDGQGWSKTSPSSARWTMSAQACSPTAGSRAELCMVGAGHPGSGPWAQRRCEVPGSDPSTALFPASSSLTPGPGLLATSFRIPKREGNGGRRAG